jgi:hypothetical protein
VVRQLPFPHNAYTECVLWKAYVLGVAWVVGLMYQLMPCMGSWERQNPKRRNAGTAGEHVSQLVVRTALCSCTVLPNLQTARLCQ